MSTDASVFSGLAFAAGILLGYLAGYLIGRKTCVRHNRHTLTTAKFLQLVVVLASVTVFVVNNIADIFVQGYDVNPLLQIINGAIIGAAMNVNVLDAIRSFFQGSSSAPPLKRKPRRRAK